ncbi:hypothetical protein JN01_0034 [Entomoplasma freundtii]|uniref:Uncharacterized protein n=1 Tax=Entomoplasma freundtii TaxID=74700 RepID=A0A2K8NTG3_9MOLU|nr:hypothetical protein [Entomoplasma freundtii]ATZ16041.1 hypothetical protein EFREU_v1c00140 [Entomoplasma freundtii]TDY58090.1 hypothetical protein JN01_0034 [Entomoplasma freundtii]
MKKLFSVIAILGLCSIPASTIVSCQTKQENDSVEKKELQKLINKVETSLNNVKKSETNIRLGLLKQALEMAKEVIIKLESKEIDYINQFDLLQEAYWGYQAQGPIKSTLKELIDDAQKVLISNENPKPDYLTKNLKESLEEAEKIFEVRNINIEAIDLAVARNNLQYHLEEFKTWVKTNYLNIYYAINANDYLPSLKDLVI